MKKINFIISAILLLLFTISCQNDMELDNFGYLRLNIESVGITNSTKAVPENYNPKQLAVKIINAEGAVVEQTEDYDEWNGRQFRLQPGTYTVEASSHGYDGLDSGFDCPYYKGSATVSVASGTEVTAQITCTLANVKVTVEWDETVLTAFQSAKAVVKSSLANVLSQEFIAGENQGAAYFPAGNLTVRYSVVNKKGDSYNTGEGKYDDYLITGLKARDHVKLVFKTAQTGTIGGVNVTVDGTTTTYTFVFNVSTEATTSLSMKEVDAWSKFAYVTGEISSQEAEKELDNTKFKFEYKNASTAVTEWKSVDATLSGNSYKATLPSLTPSTEYVCKLVYNNDAESYASPEYRFTTDVATELYNGGFEDWYKKSNAFYPCSKEYYEANGGSFWDTSNPGVKTVNINTTTEETSVVRSGKSAKIYSTFVNALIVTKFAAGSMYIGKFIELIGTSGAELDFGKPFTARPTQLTGWYNYIPKNIDHRGDNTPDGWGVIGTSDLCSVYIALTTKAFTVNNTDMSTFPNWETNEDVIAYGALDNSQCGNTGGWKQFTIDLKYANLTKKPTHIVMVCSSSKYGDYFTGGEGSVLYLDDFELLYDKEPVTK